MRHIIYRTHKVPVVAPVGMNKTDPYKTNKQTNKQTNKEKHPNSVMATPQSIWIYFDSNNKKAILSESGILPFLQETNK